MPNTMLKVPTWFLREAIANYMDTTFAASAMAAGRPNTVGPKLREAIMKASDEQIEKLNERLIEAADDLEHGRF